MNEGNVDFLRVTEAQVTRFLELACFDTKNFAAYLCPSQSVLELEEKVGPTQLRQGTGDFWQICKDGRLTGAHVFPNQRTGDSLYLSEDVEWKKIYQMSSEGDVLRGTLRFKADGFEKDVEVSKAVQDEYPISLGDWDIPVLPLALARSARFELTNISPIRLKYLNTRILAMSGAPRHFWPSKVKIDHDTLGEEAGVVIEDLQRSVLAKIYRQEIWEKLYPNIRWNEDLLVFLYLLRRTA